MRFTKVEKPSSRKYVDVLQMLFKAAKVTMHKPIKHDNTTNFTLLLSNVIIGWWPDRIKIRKIRP